MFNKLFKRPYTIVHHQTAPLANERLAYLNHLAGQGLSFQSLCLKAPSLLRITERLRLNRPPGRMISASEIERAAEGWACAGKKERWQKSGACSKELFVSIATRWLEFMGRLRHQPKLKNRFEPWLSEFDDYMRIERGLSTVTREDRCWVVNRFLGRTVALGGSPNNLTIADVDTYLQTLGDRDGYSRVSLRVVAGCLRAFFRYGAARGWWRKGIAEAIKSPRVYSLASLPSGPSWADIKRLLALTEGNDPTDIRDRAILMLLAIYGLRAGEVIHLRLDDFDWKDELLSVKCSKSKKKRVFPLSRPVGDAVLRYITKVRPRTKHREVFLSLYGPIHPICTLGHVVGKRLRQLGVSITHYGPHCLRHACATHLLAEGLSLKQIGDQLGHGDPSSSLIYAKVDIVGLRKVANFDLGELL